MVRARTTMVWLALGLAVSLVLLSFGGRAQAAPDAGPACPSGSAYNKASKMCEVAPTMQCSVGGYDSTQGLCVTGQQQQCGTGLYYWQGYCRGLPTWSCDMAGFTYNMATLDCHGEGVGCAVYVPDACVPPDCPVGSTLAFQSENGGLYNAYCSEPPTAVCPEGSAYNDTTGYCEGPAVPPCPTGTTLDLSTNLCVSPATPSCPAGFKLSSASTGPVCQYDQKDKDKDKAAAATET